MRAWARSPSARWPSSNVAARSLTASRCRLPGCAYVSGDAADSIAGTAFRSAPVAAATCGYASPDQTVDVARTDLVDQHAQGVIGPFQVGQKTAVSGVVALRVQVSRSERDGSQSAEHVVPVGSGYRGDDHQRMMSGRARPLQNFPGIPARHLGEQPSFRPYSDHEARGPICPVSLFSGVKDVIINAWGWASYKPVCSGNPGTPHCVPSSKPPPPESQSTTNPASLRTSSSPPTPTIRPPNPPKSATSPPSRDAASKRSQRVLFAGARWEPGRHQTAQVLLNACPARYASVTRKPLPV